MSRQRRLWLMVAITLLAAALRIYQLDTIPLRGDEAFSVRFWAQAPVDAWELAGTEPHPIGTFLLFWAWKSLVGDSELAMRALPLLINLLGVAVMMRLGQHLLKHKWLMTLAGLLWAINPFLLWHSQDVRNYAIWAALSPLAIWLLLLALEKNRLRDWFLYGVVIVAASHSFILEPFFLLVHGIFILLYYRERLRPAILTWFIAGITILPIIEQLTRLANSDYQATAIPVSIEVLLERFLPTLFLGEMDVPLGFGVILMASLVIGLIWQANKQAVLISLWIFIPLILLMLVGTQMSIFRPRYILPISPALILGTLWITSKGGKTPQTSAVFSFILVGLSLNSIHTYFDYDPPKAPDWRSLAQYIEYRSTENDFVVLNSTDPSFGYYYQGDAGDLPWSEIPTPQILIDQFQGVFVQTGGTTSTINQFMQDNAQFIPPAIDLVKYYRPYEATVDEIQYPLDVSFGDVAILRGYSLLGGDGFGVTVLLYWEPLRQTENEYVGFLHVPNPNGVGLIAQDDHAPLNGNAPTTVWIVGDLLRDPYYVSLPSGSHQLVVGMYENGSNIRLMVGDSDHYPLTTISIP